jgi:hypothetical protein
VTSHEHPWERRSTGAEARKCFGAFLPRTQRPAISARRTPTFTEPTASWKPILRNSSETAYATQVGSKDPILERSDPREGRAADAARPEQDVLDDIDQLMIDGLEDEDEDAEDKCAVCEDDWHGLPKYGCPGEYGTDEEKRAYRDIKQLREELNKRRDLITADKWTRSRGFDADLVIVDEAYAFRQPVDESHESLGPFTLVPPDTEAIVAGYLNATTGMSPTLTTMEETNEG